jgi:hypothetical protein
LRVKEIVSLCKKVLLEASKTTLALQSFSTGYWDSDIPAGDMKIANLFLPCALGLRFFSSFLSQFFIALYI